MVKLIVGVKGTGKTKTLIDMANEALETSSGCVVCVEKGTNLKYDIKYTARLIDTTEYGIGSAESLYGFICGLYAMNYDVTHIFIDSALKIISPEKNLEEFSQFLDSIDKIAGKNNFQCIMTASVSPENLPEEILKYTK